MAEEEMVDYNIPPIEKYFLVDIGGEQGFWLLYITIVCFAILSYKFGFAKRLPLVKSLATYMVLILGCFLFTLFAIVRFPIVEVLMVIAAVLGIYRLRLYRERNSGSE